MNPFPKSGDPPPAEAQDDQAPLGPEPSYDDVLDVAVQYTFPCSDPISVQQSSEAAAQAGKGPGETPGHGEPVDIQG